MNEAAGRPVAAARVNEGMKSTPPPPNQQSIVSPNWKVQRLVKGVDFEVLTGQAEDIP